MVGMVVVVCKVCVVPYSGHYGAKTGDKLGTNITGKSYMIMLLDSPKTLLAFILWFLTNAD